MAVNQALVKQLVDELKKLKASHSGEKISFSRLKDEFNSPTAKNIYHLHDSNYERGETLLQAAKIAKVQFLYTDSANRRIYRL